MYLAYTCITVYDLFLFVHVGHSELLVMLRTGHLESLLSHRIKLTNDMGK